MHRSNTQALLIILGGLGLLAPASQAFAQADGVCTPAEAQAGLCWQADIGYVIEAVTGPNGEFPVIDASGNSVFSYLVTGPGAVGGSCQGVRAISHASIKLPAACAKGNLTILDASPAPELKTNGQGDPSCNFGTGDLQHDVLKWDLGLACSSSQLYTLVIEGRVGAAPTTFSFKAGPQCREGTILGPGCPDVARYCPTTLNSTGQAGQIDYSGSLSISQNDFYLLASGLPPHQTGYFFFGTQVAEYPLGDGFGCIQGRIFRMDKLPILPDGTASMHFDFNLPPQDRIVAGHTLNFQFFYRDPLAGGAGFNFTDALNVTFAP